LAQFAGGGAEEEPHHSVQGQAASAVHRALASNPEATSRLVSAGLKHGVAKDSQYAAAASDPNVNSAIGKLAASSISASAPKSSSGRAMPPMPPNRSVSGTSVNSRASSVSDKAEKSANESRGLHTSRKFGDVDVSSTKNMFGSLRGSTAAKSYVAPPPLVNSAFGAKKNQYGAPPVRRVSSGEVPTLSSKEEEEEAEGEYSGEWAETLYEYSSGDPGDLEVGAGEQILVTERTSDDWWTAEFEGRKGLVPASYVKIL